MLSWRAAQVDFMLWREHLATPAERPTIAESVLVDTIPFAPNVQGLERLQDIQEQFGFENVTTGLNVRKRACSVYVRNWVHDSHQSTPNYLREYLSE